MASTPTKSGGGTPSRKAQLEAMSHEDLVQNNLKQTVLLQKLKARYDEVQKTLAGKTKESDSKMLELQDRVQEKEEVANGFKKKYSSTKEELDCTNMKLDTLMSSLQCLQEERDTFSDKIKESKTTTDTLSEKLSVVANEKQELSDRLKDNEQQVSGLKEHIKSMTGKLQSSEKLAKENANLKNEVAALNITIGTLKQGKGQNETGSPDTGKMKAIIIELKKRLKAQCEANETLENKLSAVETANESYQGKLNEVKSELENSVSSCSKLEEKLGFKMNEFHDTFVSLKSDYEKSQNEIQDLKKIIESHSAEASGMAQTLEQLNTEKEDLTNKLQSIENYVKKNDELIIENNVIKEKVVELEKLLDESTRSNDSHTLEQQIEELQETNLKILKDLENAKEKYDASYSKCEHTLSTQKQNMAILEDEKGKLEARLKEVENELKETTQQAADAQQKLECDIHSVKEDNAGIVKENVNLKASLVQIQRENDSANAKIKEMDHDNKDLSQKLQQSENELSVKVTKIQDSTERIKNLENDNAKLEEKLKMLEEGAEIQSVIQQEIAVLKTECGDLQLEKGQLDSLVKEYKCKITSFESEIDELKKDSTEKIESLSNLNSSLQNEVDVKTESFNSVQRQLEEVVDKCKEMEDKWSVANESVTSLQHSLKEAEAGKESLEKELLTTKEKLSSAQGEIDQLNRREENNSSAGGNLDAMKTKHDDLIRDFELLNEELENAKAKHNNVESELLKSKESCAHLESIMVAKETEISNLKDELEKAAVSKLGDDEKLDKYANMVKCLQDEKENLENELTLTGNKMENMKSLLEDKASDETAKFNEILDEKEKLDIEASNLRKSIKLKDEDLITLKNQLETVKQQSTEQLQSKDAEISVHITERNGLQNTVDDLEERLYQMEEDHKNRIVDKDSRYDMKVGEFNDLSKKFQENEKALESSLEDIAALRNMVDEKDSSIQNLQTKFSNDLGKLENKNEELKKEIAIKVNEVNDKTSIIKEKYAVVIELESKIKAYEVKLQEANIEFEKLSHKEKENSDSTTAEVDSLKCEILRLQQEKSELESGVSKLEMENQAILKYKEELIKNSNLLNDNLTKAKITLEDYEKKTRDETHMQNKTESELSALKEKLHEMSQQFETATNQASEGQDKCVELEAQVKSLIVELETMKSKKDEAMQKSKAGSLEATKNLEQTLKEKDEYCNKLKMVAVKAKKELEITKKKLKSTEDEVAVLNGKIQTMSTQLQGSQTQASNIQMMQLECDKLQDQLDQSEEEKKVLQKNLEDILTQLKQAQAKKNDVESELSQVKVKFDAIVNEKKDVSQLLVMTKATTEMLESERNRQGNEIESMKKNEEHLKEKIASLNEELGKQKTSLADTKQHLSEAKKGIKQHDMLALEIAQYERTVSELQDTIKTLQENLQTEIDNSKGLADRLAKMSEDRNTAEQLRIDAEDRTNQINKQLTVRREEIADMETAMVEMKGKLTDASLSVQEFQQETESVKLELSNNSAEVRRLQDKIIAMETSHQRSNDIMQRKVNTLQADCELLKTEKDSLESEYEGYKIRVHTVLKQQKSKSQDQGRKSEDEENIAQLLSANEQLKQRLLDIQTKMQLQENEFQLVNGDYERLLQQHEQDKERSSDRDTRWKARVQELQLELSTLQRQHSDMATQSKQKNENMIASHLIEIENLNETHAKAIDTIKQKVHDMENQILRLQAERSSQSRTTPDNTNRAASTPRKQQEMQSPIQASSTRPPTDLIHTHQRHSSYQQMMDYRSVAREDGEGEENPEVPQTFERLLSTASEIRPVSVISDSSLTSEGRQKYLEAKYEAQAKKLDHLSEVVRENEATVSRLTEQNRVLKEEIRRLEKNQERETSVANMEYLKNVLYKFITLPPCDEKKHLLPVMDTMLKFEAKEKATLQAMAADDGADQSQKGWSGYFQRWSGLQ